MIKRSKIWGQILETELAEKPQKRLKSWNLSNFSQFHTKYEKLQISRLRMVT